MSKIVTIGQIQKNKSAVKIHTLLDSDGLLLEFVQITEGKVHDFTAAKTMNIPEGSYLVIDRAYHDFELEQYNCYNNKGIRFVTLKKNKC